MSGLKAERRVGAATSPRREDILAATLKLMVQEGYAAVTTRRVAKEVGLTSALVHYYFPTTDGLLQAAYQRAHENTLERLARALISERPIEAIWKLNTDPEQMAIGAELLALANHRKIISLEVMKTVEDSRMLQASALSSFLQTAQVQTGGLSATAIVTLMSAIGRAITMEGAHGVTLGHAELQAAVERWARQFRREADPRPVVEHEINRPASPRRKRTRRAGTELTVVSGRKGDSE